MDQDAGSRKGRLDQTSAGVLVDPRRIGRKDVLERKGVDGGQFVGVQLADRALDLGIALVGGLQQDAELGLLLHGILPAIDALDRRDLRARRELAPDQRAREPLRFFAAADRGHHRDGRHVARSAGTTTILRSSLPAMTDRVTPMPIRSAPSRRTRSSAPVTGSPSSDRMMLPA